MGLFSSLRIGGSGLTAQRLRMDVISSNIANANTTRTQAGGPYKRRNAVLGSAPMGQGTFSLANRGVNPTGVRVVSIGEEDQVRLVEDPSHPDADADGYVAYPDIDLVGEMTDMMSAVRAYEASVASINAAKSMALKALELGR